MEKRAPGSGPRAPEHHIDVFYDGECGLCRATKAWAEGRTGAGRACFVDFRAAADVELPVSRTALEHEMWVRRPDGSLAAGFEGLRAVLATLPRWRWLAALLGLPPLRWLGPPLYRLLAEHRSRLRAG